MSFTDLFKATPQALAADRPEQTYEIYTPNDFYGNATLLKQYSGLASNYSVKASIEHGASFTDNVWDLDLNAALPGLFCFSPARREYLKKLTTKFVVATGPMISYCQPFNSIPEIQQLKQQLGKTLICFPFHSTHHIEIQMDVAVLSKHLLELKESHFDTVLVCLYWRDILLGRDNDFKKLGLETITAGHMYDPQFLPRLRTILEVADCTASNSFSTQIGYSIAVGTPYFHISLDQWTLKNEKNMAVDHAAICDQFSVTSQIKALFSKYHDSISPEQRALINQHWGLDQVMSQQQIRHLLTVLEDMYQKGPSFFANGQDVLNNYCLDLIKEQRFKEAHSAISLAENSYADRSIEPSEIFAKHDKIQAATSMLLLAARQLSSGNNEQALETIQQTIPFDISIPGLEYIRSVALINLQRWDAAKEALQKELQTFPSNQDARNLLSQIEQLS